MKNIFKINSLQVYSLWRDMANGLIVMALLLLFTYLLPSFISPLISTASAFALYLTTYSESSRSQGCQRAPSAIFLSILSYTFLLVILNFAAVWITSFNIPNEMLFFTHPFLPVILLAPVTLVTCITLKLRGTSSSVCTDCILTNGTYRSRGRFGIILKHESRVMLNNLIVLSSIMTAIVIAYKVLAFNPVNVTARDTFIFVWFPVIVLLLDTVYFAIRYYNLYLDMRERDQIVTPLELSEMSSRTWVRYYVICEDNVFLNTHFPDLLNETDTEGIIETPFVVNRDTDSISEDEAAAIIRRLTGVREGKLRFFFGRRSPDNLKHNVMRFFYLLPGDLEMYPALNEVEGTWISSNKFKTMFYSSGTRLSPLLNTDMRRLSTIIITSKTYNEKGERRTKLRQYRPSFTFEELYDTKLNFQDNAWLHVSYFNCDVPYFRLRRIWRSLTRRKSVAADD